MIRNHVQFAQRLVKALTEILPFAVSFTDENGYIISDSDKNRIGTLHSPSVKVLEKGKMIEFERANVMDYDNVLPGIAVPLVFDDETIGVLGIVGEPEEVQPYAKLVQKYVEMMWQESKRKHADDLMQMKLESFLHYILLDGDKRDNGQLKIYASLLGINASISRVCIMIDIGHYVLKEMNKDPHITANLLESVEGTFGFDENNIVSFLASEKIILLKPVRDEVAFKTFIENFTVKANQLIDWLKGYNMSHVLISAGNRAASLFDVSKSYQEAEKLLNHGKLMNNVPKVLTYYDWDILLAILPSRVDHEFKHYVRDRLNDFFKDEQKEELSDDFLTYCKCNMNVSQAAKQLYIHRNTLMYRLRKIEKLTGLDMNNFEHCMIFYFLLNESIS